MVGQEFFSYYLLTRHRLNVIPLIRGVDSSYEGVDSEEEGWVRFHEMYEQGLCHYV